jgi:two-component sensor histidine kinase
VDRYDGAHFDTLCIPLRDGAGPVTAVAVFSHEITGLKLAEEALRESEERYRALAEENSRLLAQARQDAESKSILLQEVNHRVKNNLSAILGILELELGRPAGAPADFHKMLEALGLRIRGLAMVHDILTASAWLPVRLDGLLSTIIHGALVTLPAGKEITVSVEGDTLPLWVVPKQATALALIANELATNSIKYAFTDRTDGRISVSIRQETDATVTLEYRDDGPGWPPVVLSGSGESIGLRLIRLNARSPLRGALDLSNDGGAVARLRFALNPPADTTSAKGPA